MQTRSTPPIQNGLILSPSPTFLAEPTFADRYIICLWAGMAKSPKWDPQAVHPPGRGVIRSLPSQDAISFCKPWKSSSYTVSKWERASNHTNSQVHPAVFFREYWRFVSGPGPGPGPGAGPGFGPGQGPGPVQHQENQRIWFVMGPHGSKRVRMKTGEDHILCIRIISGPLPTPRRPLER